MSRYIPSLSVEAFAPTKVSDSDIREAEATLGVRFDQPLKQYLKNPIIEDDGAICEYVGLNRNGHLNTITATESYRAGNARYKLLASAVVLAEIGNGDCYFYDTKTSKIGIYLHDGPLEYPKDDYAKSLVTFSEYAFKETTSQVSQEGVGIAIAGFVGIAIIAKLLSKVGTPNNTKQDKPVESAKDKIEVLLYKLGQGDLTLKTTSLCNTSLLGEGKKNPLAHCTEVYNTIDKYSNALVNTFKKFEVLKNRLDDGEEYTLDMEDEFSSVDAEVYKVLKPIVGKNINWTMVSGGDEGCIIEYRNDDPMEKELKTLSVKDMSSLLLLAVKMLALCTELNKRVPYCTYNQGRTELGWVWSEMLTDTCNDIVEFVDNAFE